MKIRSRWFNMILSYLATFCLRLLFLTARVQHRAIVDEASPYARSQSPQRYTFCMWHDQIVLAVFSLRTWNLAGLISQHRDGGYLADSVLIAGIQPVRGSTSRGVQHQIFSAVVSTGYRGDYGHNLATGF